MTQYERDLSNLSYTNKDFGQIYPELLDLAKKISYKWDPSQSDESDPGVVLLKIAAIIADKNNYNIDKNILETFPLSVTQIRNARQIFEQCGYCMKYYKSATTTLSLTLPKSNEPSIDESDLAELSPNDSTIDLSDDQFVRSYVIPKFTMFSDLENTVVYTIIEDAIIRSDGITVDNIPAVQGVINTYRINGESVITAANLDYNNRLYFTELDIPENGIFISDSQKRTWSKVDNLVLQPIGTLCYKFGLSEDGSSCYVEFPDDIDTIIGNGITINYLRTQGQDGNVGRKRLCQFYSDVTATRYIDTLYPQEVVLTTYENAEQGNVYITNPDAATNGRNPETIDEAYRNYQKIKTTFETLVSLRDYENFLYTNENVSNSFVCDRTNDIQSSYKIVSSDGITSSTTTMIHEKDGSPELTPFDLRVYGLTYVDNPTTDKGFNQSFTVIDQKTDTVTDWLEIISDTDNIKSIQHNYKDFEINRIMMIMNRYPIISKIIPQYKLETKQQEEVINNVVVALYNVLNSRVIDFGSPIEYDLVYDTIVGADPRIKAITLNDIEYTTYAIYKGSDMNIHELRIDSNSTPPDNSSDLMLWKNFRKEIYAKSVLAGKTQLFNPDTRFTYALNHTDSRLIQDVYRLTTNTDIVATMDESCKDSEGNVDISRLEYDTAQLKVNENIVFTSPKMVEDVPYSSYVKFLHNIGLSSKDRPSQDYVLTENDILINIDDDYTLKENEYIMFFWKDDDDEYAPYQYIKYTGKDTTKIISPSFKMMIQRQPSNGGGVALPNIPDNIIESIPSGKRGSTDRINESVIGKVMVGGSQEKSVTLTFTDYVKGLKGSEFVLTGTNTIKTKKPNRIHINNSINGTNNVYWILNEVINGRCTLFKKDDIEYTLKSGEYFIYSNDSKTQLNILGAGTVISRSSKSATDWSCSAVSYDRFISEGVHYLDGKWFIIPSNYEVHATEMQFYQIGSGNSIRLKMVSSTVSEGYIPPETITFKNEDNKLYLYQYKISYVDETGVETQLPARNSLETCWRAYSILNLNVSSTKVQHLDGNQSIILYNKDGLKTETLTEQSIFTNRNVSLTGGSNLDATTLDIINNVPIPLEIYGYVSASNYSDSSGMGEIAFNNSSTWVKIPTDTYTQTINFTLPVGTYILPLCIESSLDNLQITLNNGIVKTVSDTSDYSNQGIYYLKIEVTGQSGLLIGECKLDILSTLSDTVPSYITFNQLFKYTTDLIPEEVSDITKFIDSTLDKKHLFNYTYIVPESDKIQNPLDSIEFLDTNHIFNSYTICRWDTESSLNKLIVTNKIK